MIADSIELVARGHCFDARRRDLGLRQDDPGTVMALARLDVPVADALRRLDPAGSLQGPARSPSRMCSRPSARIAAGTMTDEELHELEERRLAGRGRMRRAVHREHDGDGLRGARHLALPAPRWSRPRTRRKLGVARAGGRTRDGRAAPRAAAERASSRQAALENAIAAVATSGGSTNGVLHLLAVAREIGVELEHRRVRRRSPSARR